MHAQQALGRHCTDGALPASMLQQLGGCLLDILSMHTEVGQAPDGAFASRLYFTVLRTLQSVLMQVSLPQFVYIVWCALQISPKSGSFLNR